MKLIIRRDRIEIVPQDSGYPNYDERDSAFIEEVLGLKNDGDSIELVRVNASGLSCIAYLRTKDKAQANKADEADAMSCVDCGEALSCPICDNQELVSK